MLIIMIFFVVFVLERKKNTKSLPGLQLPLSKTTSSDYNSTDKSEDDKN